MCFKTIQWINKVTKLNKTTMDTFQNNIKKAIEEDESRHTYSMAETKLEGVKWVDGKQIYRKAYILNNITNDGKAKNFDLDIDNLERIVLLYGGFNYKAGSNTGYIPFNFYNVEVGKGTTLFSSGNKIAYISNYEGTNAVIVVEYTKTTD